MSTSLRIRSSHLVHFLSAAMIVLSLGAASLGTGSARRAAAQDAGVNTIDQFASVMLPNDLGQSEIQAYVPETGHSVRGYFLDYWRANGAASVYGNPISEPFASANGYYSQAFENGVFQYIPDLVWTDSPSVSLMPISWTYLQRRLDDIRPDGRRGAGGGDRRTSAWKALNPAGKTAQNAVSTGAVFNDQTSHTITGKFLDWYNGHEGSAYLGNPISQPVAERGVTVQYFDGAMLMQDDTGNVQVAPLAREMASALGIDTTSVDQAGMPTYDESLFWTADNPNPLGDLGASGRKWIEVSISQQTAWVYQGSTLISQSLVSTGIEPNGTQIGVFHVRYKLAKTDMTGTTNAAGEVVSLGETSAQDPQPGETPYIVKDVPNVMYFNNEAEALHGAYWHNNFGNPMSHGCVNLPLDFAAFLFGWAPLGTMVWVHQ